MKLARLLLYYKIDVHHKLVHSEGSDEFAHLGQIQKVLPEEVRL